MSDIEPARQALIERILNGDGTASRAQRRSAFDNAGLSLPLATLVDKVAKHASEVSDEDVTVALSSGLSEDRRSHRGTAESDIAHAAHSVA